MKRNDIISEVETLTEDSPDAVAYVEDVLDHYEQKFNEIRDLLNITEIGQLGQIQEAVLVADNASSDLY